MRNMDFKKIITGCILGAKGSGKSVFLADLSNTLGKGCILIDVLGVYNPKNAFKTAIVPNSFYVSGVDLFINNFKNGNITIRDTVVIDVSKSIGQELIEEIDKLSSFLMDSKLGFALLSDEVADFMSQTASYSKEFHRLVKNGRNYGIRPVIFATQRPQSVRKEIFDLCDTFFISSQKAPATIDYIERLVQKPIAAEIARLEQREFLIYDGELNNYKVPSYKWAFRQ